jgi:ribosome modulation factor
MAKAQAKDGNVVELRKNGPSEDAFVASNLGKLIRADEDLQNAKNSHQSTVKHVETKIDVKAARWAIKLKKSGKLEEAVEEMRKRVEYAYILGIPVNKKQLDLFRVEGVNRDATAKAEELGRYAGIMGYGEEKCPYSPDSDLGVAWGNACKAGGEERKLILSMEPGGTERIAGDTDDDVFDEDEE